MLRGEGCQFGADRFRLPQGRVVGDILAGVSMDLCWGISGDVPLLVRMRDVRNTRSEGKVAGFSRRFEFDEAEEMLKEITCWR